MDIARHIKVVILLLLFFLWLNNVIDQMSTTTSIQYNNCIDYVQISATVLCLLYFNRNIITRFVVKRFLHPPTNRISVGGIIFVTSQIQENNFVVQTSHAL